MPTVLHAGLLLGEGERDPLGGPTRGGVGEAEGHLKRKRHRRRRDGRSDGRQAGRRGVFKGAGGGLGPRGELPRHEGKLAANTRGKYSVMATLVHNANSGSRQHVVLAFPAIVPPALAAF